MTSSDKGAAEKKSAGKRSEQMGTAEKRTIAGSRAARRLIGEGAEARLYSIPQGILKVRSPKTYRIAPIDMALRMSRTRREAKVLETLARNDFLAPRLISIDEKKTEILMEEISGKKVRDALTSKNCAIVGARIGTLLARLHNLNIIHADPTTSNMILSKKEIYLIDFGLSYFSHRVEDKAVDLHLLRTALESKHHTIWERCFAAAKKGYLMTAADAPAVLARFATVEERGRNKAKY